jgi:hypothetical protein
MEFSIYQKIHPFYPAYKFTFYTDSTYENVDSIIIKDSSTTIQPINLNPGPDEGIGLTRENDFRIYIKEKLVNGNLDMVEIKNIYDYDSIPYIRY